MAIDLDKLERLATMVVRDGHAVQQAKGGTFDPSTLAGYEAMLRKSQDEFVEHAPQFIELVQRLRAAEGIVRDLAAKEPKP